MSLPVKNQGIGLTGNQTFTPNSSWFNFVNVFQPPTGALWVVNFPLITSLASYSPPIGLRNNSPTADFKIALGTDPSLGNAPNTIIGIPTEFYLCGDECKIFAPDTESLTNWQVAPGVPSHSRQHHYLETAHSSPINFGSNTYPFQDTGVQGQLPEKLQTAYSRERVRARLIVGGLAGTKAAFCLSDGTGDYAVQVAYFFDQNQTLQVDMEYQQPGGVAFSTTPRLWKAKAFVFPGGPGPLILHQSYALRGGSEGAYNSTIRIDELTVA